MGAHVKICTPFYSDYNSSLKLSLLNLTKMGDRLPYTWEHQGCQGVNPAIGRNMCVNQGSSTAIKQKLDEHITHFLFVDADIEWYPENIFWLIDRNLPIVSGAYKARNYPLCYQAGMWDLVPGNPGKMVSQESHGVVQADWIGAGFLLVKREVLETLEFPWFRHMCVQYMESIPDGKVVMHQIESEEDIGFSMNAAAHGFKLWLDCELHTQHSVDGPRCAELVGSCPTKLLPTVLGYYTNGSTGMSSC